MFSGILGGQWENEQQNEKKSVFKDFNLDIIINKINSLSRGYDLQPLYSYIPRDKAVVEYRRALTDDFQNPELRELFGQYSSRIERVKKYEKAGEYNNHPPQARKWHADAMYEYVTAVSALLGGLREVPGYSAPMSELIDFLEEYASSEAFLAGRELAEELHDLVDEPVKVYIQKNRIVLDDESEQRDFAKRMREAFGIPDAEPVQWELKVNTDKLTPFENEIAERTVKGKKLDKRFRQLWELKPDPVLMSLAYEVQFYLGFYRFLAYMEREGYEFALPEFGDELRVRDGYDVALVLKEDGERVVANDFHMEGEERFFVITGANGGGKTTFARMVGQILYFGQMGLMAPCRSAVLPYFPEVLSHFSNEESDETGKGKLMEELTRLKPMMEKECTGCFIVLNELFTTAATMDAGIMGKKVLKHFIEMGCYGIYVTHIQALADESEHIVSLVAELEEDHHTRSFKIVRKPAREGEYEDSLITEYGMTYEQMKKVIEDGN